MQKIKRYLMFAFIVLSSCESVYIPDLDQVESLLVVDARLFWESGENYIIVNESNGFNDSKPFNPVTNALVQLLDNNGNGYITTQTEPGVYKLNTALDAGLSYSLHIIARGETFVSGFEKYLPVPHIDSIYGNHAEHWIQPGGETRFESFLKSDGQRVFIDIDTENQKRFYRFESRKILQYHLPFDTIIGGVPIVAFKFGWKSFYPEGGFNIATASEYSKDMNISKHPMDFFPYDASLIIKPNVTGSGWIYILKQYSVSEQAYNFYRDLNYQLEAKGKIFDPMYVQAKNNLRCSTNPKKIILGNFEIGNYKEFRFFVKPDKFTGDHIIKKIDRYDVIPESGLNNLYRPWFWQN
jgi:hypothetical protein